jgi:hypothetical protein
MRDESEGANAISLPSTAALHSSGSDHRGKTGYPASVI